MDKSQKTAQIELQPAQPPNFRVRRQLAASAAWRSPPVGGHVSADTRGSVDTPPQKKTPSTPRPSQGEPARRASGFDTPSQNSTAPRIIAAIPCYNEADFIAGVVRRTQPHVDRVVVVDDGSTDGTADAARAAGAGVRRHPTNLGPGAAARTCLQAGRELGAHILVTLDGDGQHDPDEIPAVLSPILSGDSDLVIGSRFLGGYNNVARYRKFGIDVITSLYNVGARQSITDAQSCFRAYGHRALQVLAIAEDGFGFSVETLVQARSAGLRIDEVSISCIYHDQSHSMNPVLHGVGVALMVVKHRALRALDGGRR